MTGEKKKKFGYDLKTARHEKDLTQDMCARQCGVSTYSYQNWERGIKSPKAENMELICKFLGLNVGDYE